MQVNKVIMLISLLFTCCFSIESPIEQEVVILGSGPAGLTAAIYTARAGLDTLIIEGQEPGGQIALSYEVENFPAFPDGINGFELTWKMREQASRFGTSIISDEIVKADLESYPFHLSFKSGKTILAKALIIATGAAAKWLDIPGESDFIGNGVSSCATCDGFQFKDMEVAVIGGGDSAIEDALFLTTYASKITVIHRKDTLKASPYLQKKAFLHPKISFLWDSEVQAISDPEQGIIEGLHVLNIKTQEKLFLPSKGVFVAIGHTPNSETFKNTLQLTKEGYIITKPKSTETSIPGVFAAGDIADPHYRQAITAAGTGAMAGIDAYHFIKQKESTP